MVLALCLAVDGAITLVGWELPERSAAGLVILVLSVLVILLLARAKRRVHMRCTAARSRLMRRRLHCVPVSP
jgi:hypothetical protein